MIEMERQGNVSIVRLCHGKASALDTEFLQAIASTIQDVEASDAGACVITGSGGIFSAGVDLKRLTGGGAEYVRTFMPALDAAFSSLFGFSKPLIAACNGHAIAGGCVILSCCDLRYVAEGKGRIGVPELLVGVPFPLMALEIMRATVPKQYIQKVLYEGGTYAVEEALALGLCDEILPADQVLDKAVQMASQLASYPRDAFVCNKKQLRRPVWDTMNRYGESDNEAMLELWSSDAVLNAVRAYVAKTLG